MKQPVIILFLVLLVFGLYQCIESGRASAVTAATYAGTATCKTCHATQYADYITSDHYHAMDSVSAASVKGNFNNSFFVYHADTTRFFTQHGKYFVKTKDSTGVVKDFEVAYTLGWHPLQQYLVKFDDGRIQSLPFCWDTRPVENGGQRWFHLYSNEKVLPGDELFWTGINQNWNYMCADCHTTNYKTNFDAPANTFKSSWNEAKVSCESCHGPASQHIEWAAEKNAGDSLKGFSVSLKPIAFSWRYDTARGIRMPVNPVHQTAQVENCARCHARATRLSDAYVHGQPFMQTHLPALPDTSIYYVDGQIKDENYEYGSFLQSKMYAAGVTCTDCHQPHSMKLRAGGNAVCASCHSPEKFDQPAHTHHKTNSTGSSCKSCHMPTSVYMGVDERFDHSMRNPRPDLSLQNATPTACNTCHADKTVQWAAASFTKWYGSKIKAEPIYALLMTTVLKTNANSRMAFNQLLANDQFPSIIKATAMQQYRQYSQADLQTIEKGIGHADPMMRLAAVRALRFYPAEIAIAAATPLLQDNIRTVRFEALNILSSYYSSLPGETVNIFLPVMNEYLAVQQNLSHRPEGFLNQASMKFYTGQPNDALQLYLTGIRRFPRFMPFYVNLADLYRATGQEAEAKKMIDQAMQINPTYPQLHYVLGLWHVRKHNHQAALQSLKKAMDLDPKNPSLVYAYAVGVHSDGRQQMAVALLQNYLASNGNDNQIMSGLISFLQAMNKTQQAEKYKRLRKEVFGY